MLLLAIRVGRANDALGQLIRLVAAGPASLSDRVPVGNTGSEALSGLAGLSGFRYRADDLTGVGSWGRERLADSFLYVVCEGPQRRR